MGTIRSRLLIAALLLLSITLFLLCVFARPLVEIGVRQVLKELRGRGIRISVEKVDISLSAVTLPAIGLHNVQTLFPVLLPGSTAKFPFAVELREVIINPSFLSIISGSPQILVDAKGYGGSVFAGLQANGERVYGDLRLSNLDLREHPQISALGISSGVLSLEVMKFDTVAGVLKSLEGLFLLENLSIPRVPTFNIPLNLPAFADGSLSSKITVTPDLIALRDVDLRSSWGSIEGSLSLPRPDAESLSQASGVLQVRLTPMILEKFGTFIALFSKGALLATSERFSLQISSSACLAKEQQIKIGGQCLQIQAKPL